MTIDARSESVLRVSSRESRPALLSAVEGFVNSLNSPVMRAVTVWAAHFVLLFRRAVPGRLVQRMVLWFVRTEAACCRAESPHFKFMQRHVERFERAGTFERMRRFLGEGNRAAAARRLDAWMRIGLLGSLRHEVLERYRGTRHVPPRMLTEVQLALSPGCDLTCEGCYTAEDRGGTAPREDDIAYLVDEAVSCGAFVVHVIGKGEPFLSPTWAQQLLDVIEQRPHVFFTIATHGMHITESMARRIGRIGNLTLLIAVDGPEAVHDARRGSGSYGRVHDVMAMLRRYDAVFGFTCMVSAKSRTAVTAPEFVGAQADAGCSLGIYSRYFPLTSTDVDQLALDAGALNDYRAQFESLQNTAPIALIDLDDVEQATGCHSRAGESVYIDGITGQVSPCLRVPFAPQACRVDRVSNQRLIDALSHSFFVEYRRATGQCPSWCGANLEGELHAVSTLLNTHSPSPQRLADYQIRSREHNRPVRRLPIVTGEPRA